MDLGTFHSTISSIIQRGNKYDPDIVLQARLAARQIEDRYNLEYMKRREDFTLVLEDSEISFYSDRIKRWEWVRLPTGNDEKPWHYLVGGDPQEFNRRQAGMPNRYWYEEGKDTMVFDRVSDATYEGELLLYEYTDWPTDITKTHWLLEHAEMAMSAMTLVMLAPICRRPQLKDDYKEQLAMGLEAVVIADDEYKAGNTSHSMGIYVG